MYLEKQAVSSKGSVGTNSSNNKTNSTTNNTRNSSKTAATEKPKYTISASPIMDIQIASTIALQPDNIIVTGVGASAIKSAFTANPYVAATVYL